jgi:NADPH:quinone reductase
MRAFAVGSFGEAPAIHDLAIPAADGAFLIRVKCAGVNPIDYKLVERLTAASTYPFVMGIDFAGVVERVPAAERNFLAGDRIFGMARAHGAYAEYTAVAPGSKTEPLARIPDGVTDEQAAALPIPAITALGSVELPGVRAGQRLVVMGATGGVGGYAVQMARSRGTHVIATVLDDADEARRLGAEEVHDTKAGDVIDVLRAAHPEGVDAVLDLVNGPEAWFAERKIKAHNISSIANPLASPQGLTVVVRMLANGTITARIRSTVELDGAGQTLVKLRNGGLSGKAVIRL